MQEKSDDDGVELKRRLPSDINRNAQTIQAALEGDESSPYNPSLGPESRTQESVLEAEATPIVLDTSTLQLEFVQPAEVSLRDINGNGSQNYIRGQESVLEESAARSLISRQVPTLHSLGFSPPASSNADSDTDPPSAPTPAIQRRHSFQRQTSVPPSSSDAEPVHIQGQESVVEEEEVRAHIARQVSTLHPEGVAAPTQNRRAAKDARSLPFEENPFVPIALPSWTTSAGDAFRTSLQIVRLIWQELLVLLVIAGIWGAFFETGLLPPSGQADFNTVVFTSISFVLAFLLQTRVGFSLTRYATGAREYVTLCNHTLQLSFLLSGLCQRTTPPQRSDVPPIDRITLSLTKEGEARSVKDVLSEIGVLLRVIPYAIIDRFKGSGEIDYPSLNISENLIGELAGFHYDGTHALFCGLMRRFGILLELDVIPQPYGNSVWRCLQDLTGKVGLISAARRNPTPRVYRDFLYAVVFVYLAAFPVICWATYGYATLFIEPVYSFALLGVIAVADEVKEPFSQQEKFIGFNMESLAKRTAKTVDETMYYLLSDMRRFSEKGTSSPSSTPSGGVP